MIQLQGELTDISFLCIGVVTSCFNAEVTERLEQGAFKRLKELEVADKQIIATRVPGALEIPLATQALFEQGCDGVVALGAVIRGETSHYDSVCEGVERGCSYLQTKYKKPVAFGVLTTENKEQALARSGGVKGNKGVEVVNVVIEMMSLLKQVREIKKKA